METRHPYKFCYEVVALGLNSIVQPCNSIKIEALIVDNIIGVVIKIIESELLKIMRGKKDICLLIQVLNMK